VCGAVRDRGGGEGPEHAATIHERDEGREHVLHPWITISPHQPCTQFTSYSADIRCHYTSSHLLRILIFCDIRGLTECTVTVTEVIIYIKITRILLLIMFSNFLSIYRILKHFRSRVVWMSSRWPRELRGMPSHRRTAPPHGLCPQLTAPQRLAMEPHQR